MQDKQRETDLKLQMGDFNAKIRADNSGHEVMGTRGLGRMNENKELLAGFFAFTTWSCAVSSHTRTSTRPPASPMTMCALGESSDGRYRK